MANWKTTLFGIASIVSFVVGYFWPEYREFCTGLTAVLVAGGFIVAKDGDVTGGKREQ